MPLQPMTETAKKPPCKSLFLPLSPDPDIENVDDDSDTELLDPQIPMRVSDIRRNVQMIVPGEQLQRRAQIKEYKRSKELENMEHVSTSSPPTPEAFSEPSASSYPPEPEHLENINQPSSPPPPEPFPEPSPSPEPQELEPQPSTSYRTIQTPAKTYELDRSTHLCCQLDCRLQVPF